MWQSISKAIGALTSQDDAGSEYDIAAERIQSALLRVSAPSVPGFDLGVRAEPARLVGGDYIDIFARQGYVLFGLGDASGKSLGAALNALMLRYLLRGLVQVLGHADLGTLLSHVNTVVAEDLDDTDYFITLLVGTLHCASGRLRVANAGHEPPLVLRKGAAHVEELTEHGIVLGALPQTTYPHEETVLHEGDRAVFYTDGLTEATNKSGELYTIECLRQNFEEHRDLDAQGLADALFDAVKAYSDGRMRDDATILVVRRVAVDV